MNYLNGAWLTWRGSSTLDFELIVRKLPVFQAGEERVKSFEIPGRDGTLHIADGSAESYTVNCEIIMLDDERRGEVFAWLRGSGVLITSDDPDHAVRARVVNKINPTRIAPKVRDFLVVFEVQPYRYEASPETVTLTASGAINNHGTASCYPLITVTGTGVLTIDSAAYVFAESGITLNSDIQECYAGAVNKNNKVSGGFPVLTPGVHTITLGAGITSVEILTNARWY